MQEVNEIHIDTSDAEDAAMDDLVNLIRETTIELDYQPSLKKKQEYTINVLDEILNWNIEHGYFDTLFPIFREFMEYLPEDRLNSFIQELGKYSRLRIE